MSVLFVYGDKESCQHCDKDIEVFYVASELIKKKFP